MEFELPESVRPVWALLVHVAVGAAALAGLLVIELALAGFVHLLGMASSAPEWFETAANLCEQGLFGFDIVIAVLFLAAELTKFVRALWREIRDE